MSIHSTAITPANRDAYPCSNQIYKNIYDVGLITAAGALAGYTFRIIDPVGGAVFGASYALTIAFAKTLSAKLNMNETAKKIAFSVASLVVSIGMGIFTVTTAGFPLTVLGGVGMLLTMIVTAIAIRIFGFVAGWIAACAGGAALACKERYC